MTCISHTHDTTSHTHAGHTGVHLWCTSTRRKKKKTENFSFCADAQQEIKWTMNVSRSIYLLLLPHYTHIARPILTEEILLMHEQRVHIAILTRRQYTITTAHIRGERETGHYTTSYTSSRQTRQKTCEKSAETEKKKWREISKTKRREREHKKIQIRLDAGTRTQEREHF